MLEYASIDSARAAKTRQNKKPFIGHPLGIRYAPEYESVADARTKLEERRTMVADDYRQKMSAQVAELIIGVYN